MACQAIIHHGYYRSFQPLLCSLTLVLCGWFPWQGKKKIAFWLAWAFFFSLHHFGFVWFGSETSPPQCGSEVLVIQSQAKGAKFCVLAIPGEFAERCGMCASKGCLTLNFCGELHEGTGKVFIEHRVRRQWHITLIQQKLSWLPL